MNTNLTAALGTAVTAPAPAAKAPRKPRKAAPAKAPAKASKAPAKGKAPAAAAPAKGKGKAPAKAAARKPAKAPAKAPAKGKPERQYTIDAERPTQNGKTRPSASTQGGKLWAEFEALEKKMKGVLPSLEQAKAHCEEKGFNPTTVVLAYYGWRKFWGIRGRQ